MIKHFCDVCGRELSDDDYGIIEGNLYISGNERNDLCFACASQFNSIVFSFLQGEIPDNDTCLSCKYCECSIDEEPCISCSHHYVNKFKRRNV